METKHFWDLEETCIDNWHDGLLVNVQKLRQFVRDNGVREISIFSFAIWYDDHRKFFNLNMKEPIERAFGVKIVEVLTADEIRKIVCGHMSAQFDLTDFLALWGKKRSFPEFCSARLSNCRAVLLDDCVPNMTITDHDNKLVIELVDVTKPLRRL